MEVKLLSCPLCFKPHFEGVDSLRSTLVSVATSPLTCPVCCEVLIGLDKLTIHLFSHANPPEKTEDTQTIVQKEIDDSINNICNNTTTINVLNEQVPQGLEESRCDIGIAVEENDLIVCDICNFTFTDRNILEMHQKLLHQTTPDKKTGLYSYHCHLCSKKFRMRGSLMVHLRVAHYGFGHHNDIARNLLQQPKENVETVVENDKDKGKGQAKGQVPGKGNDNKQWECDVCSKMFTTKYFLKKHKRLHTGEMPYCCNLCNKSFTFQQSYHKHMLYHSSEKPYVCNECGRAFKELSTLQNHARIHSGERPYGCETCDSDDSYYITVDDFPKSEHRQEEERTWKMSSIYIKMQQHTSGKRFRQRVSYLVHRRIHTGDMPYKCTACDKSFRYKVSQRSHKCPMNPPGSVVKVPEQPPKSPKDNPQGNVSPTESPSNNVKCIMSVDYNTGNINFIPQEDNKINERLRKSKVDNNQNSSKDSLKCNIEVDYNSSAIDSVLITPSTVDISQIKMKPDVRETCNGSLPTHEQVILNRDAQPDQSNDIFSMVLSPILPEVESLCLNSNSPINSGPISPIVEENVHLMRDQCFDQLLYGPCIGNLRR